MSIKDIEREYNLDPQVNRLPQLVYRFLRYNKTIPFFISIKENVIQLCVINQDEIHCFTVGGIHNTPWAKMKIWDYDHFTLKDLKKMARDFNISPLGSKRKIITRIKRLAPHFRITFFSGGAINSKKLKLSPLEVVFYNLKQPDRPYYYFDDLDLEIENIRNMVRDNFSQYRNFLGGYNFVEVSCPDDFSEYLRSCKK